MEDSISRWVSDDGFAIAIVRATSAAQIICRDQHELADQPAAVLASGMVAALLLGTRLKGPGQINLSYSGDEAAFGHFRCDAIGMGSVRGMVLPLIHERLAEWDGTTPLLGPGKLQVNRQLADEAAPYQTILEVDGLSVGHMANRYLHASEQVSAAIAIDVNMTGDQQHVAGLYIERLPGADVDHPLSGKLAAIGEHPGELSIGPDDQALLNQLAPSVDYKLLHEYPAGFHCPCSRERFIATLRGFSTEQLTDLSNGAGVIETVCDFCRSRYDIALDEVI